jgi:ribonuclease HI
MSARVQLIWVPGHEGIVGNETADQLVKTGSEHPFIEPEPPCGNAAIYIHIYIHIWTATR